ncbi:MAG: peroxiredoxin [Myxococcota bacterium]
MNIVGVGFDEPDEMAEWAADEGFQYEVWTDDDRTLAVHYGAARNASAAFADRVTMLLGSDGQLLLEYTSNIDFGTHPIEVLEDCEILFGGQ